MCFRSTTEPCGTLRLSWLQRVFVKKNDEKMIVVEPLSIGQKRFKNDILKSPKWSFFSKTCKIFKPIFSKKFWDVGHRTLLLPNAAHAHSPLGQPCSYHSHSSRGLESRNEWMQWARERAHNFYRKMLRASYSGSQGSVALLKYIFLINFLLSFEWYRSHCKSIPFVIEHYCEIFGGVPLWLPCLCARHGFATVLVLLANACVPELLQ